MDILSYVITHDSGFAPNPFGGILSLATCKPQIRKTAGIGDLIIGTGSKAAVGNGKLVFAGKVSNIIPIEIYGKSSNFEFKLPKSRGIWWEKHGDNIYFKKDTIWIQRRNIHHGNKEMQHDLGGINVLLCPEYWYFGKAAIEIPEMFHTVIKKGPGHKRIKDKSLINRFYSWLEGFPRGINGNPFMEALNKRLKSDHNRRNCGCGGLATCSTQE